MPDLSVQFYATQDEVADSLKKWVLHYGIQVAAMRFLPFSIALVTDDVSGAVRDADVNRLVLLHGPAVLNVRDKADFEDKNEGGLILDLGRVSESGLAQSWLTCRTDNDDAFVVWKKIARDLRRWTTAGTTAINRQNGATEFDRENRYSPGARGIGISRNADVANRRIEGPHHQAGQPRSGFAALNTVGRSDRENSSTHELRTLLIHDPRHEL
jgi:hypothetical protein